MKIKKLIIENFKSIKRIEIEDVPAACVFIGPNGAGKSNIADAVAFIFTSVKKGLKNTLLEFGGFERVCHVKKRRFGYMFLGVELEAISNGEKVSIIIEYKMKAESDKVNTKVKISEEKILVSYGSRQMLDYFQNGDAFGLSGLWRLTDSDEMPKKYLLELMKKFNYEELATTHLKQRIPEFGTLLDEILPGVGLFRISSLTCRQPGVPMNTQLGVYGENLPSVLNYIKEDKPELFHSIIDFMRGALPSLEEIRVEVGLERNQNLSFKESEMKRGWSALEVSDGTIRLLGLITALYDSSFSCVILEEPENNLHERLLENFYKEALKASEDRQIILTTHSLQLLDRVSNPETVFVVWRVDGETHVKRITEIEGVVDNLQFELIGGMLATGGIKEFLPGYKRIK